MQQIVEQSQKWNSLIPLSFTIHHLKLQFCSWKTCNMFYRPTEANLKTRRERPKSAPYLRLKNIQEQVLETFEKNHFFQKQ